MLVIVATLALLLLSGCANVFGDGGDDAPPPGPTVDRPEPSGEPRGVALGLGAVPTDLTADGYVAAFATAARYADVVLVRKTPPWREFSPGGDISSATRAETQLERDLLEQYDHLDLLFAIDPTDPRVQRARVFDAPAGVDPTTALTDPDMRQAFVAYTTYVVRNYQPEYLAIGVEVNMTATRNPPLFGDFVSLYREAYVAAKEANPDTKVFPTFQLEDLLGRYDAAHPPQWELVDRFAGMMDVLAVSTYPYIAYTTAGDIPEDYFGQLREQWEGEIIIAETGYTSRPVADAPSVGTPSDQDAYLARIFADAETHGFALVVWFAPLDPPAAATGVTSVFRHIGLRERNGANKPAWERWEAWALRPLESSP